MPPGLDLLGDPPAGRPLWLTTLADLGLLLLGFFVFLHASSHLDPHAIGEGMRRAFSADATLSAPPAMATDIARVTGFRAASAVADRQSLAGIADWARSAAADPRTTIHLAGDIDGSASDVDPATGSSDLLANDRARAVAAFLIRSGAAAPSRLVIDAAGRGSRSVTLTIEYAGLARGSPSAGEIGTALAADRAETKEFTR